MKLLLLEDSQWFAESLSSMLSTDFDICVYHDPENIFETIENWQPDVMLADVVLGTKNLFVLLHEMQSYVDTRQLPVVVLTSIAGQLDAANLEKFNVRKVLDKTTITPDVLRQTLCKVVTERRVAK